MREAKHSILPPRAKREANKYYTTSASLPPKRPLLLLTEPGTGHHRAPPGATAEVQQRGSVFVRDGKNPISFAVWGIKPINNLHKTYNTPI